MEILLWILHIIIVLSLIAVILVQRGRSGGLVEALGGVESIFGTKTSTYIVKLTVVLAICFFGTSIGLAYLSKEKSKSLMDKYDAAASTQSSPEVTGAAKFPVRAAAAADEPLEPVNATN